MAKSNMVKKYLKGRKDNGLSTGTCCNTGYMTRNALWSQKWQLNWH